MENAISEGLTNIISRIRHLNKMNEKQALSELTSLQKLTLVISVEKAFSISIGNEEGDLECMHSLEKLAELVYKKTAGR